MPANETLWNAPSVDPDYDRHQAERQTWFNKIAPRPNWKTAIDCWIKADDVDDCREACIFFTGSFLSVAERRGNLVRVTAQGYYAICGA